MSINKYRCKERLRLQRIQIFYQSPQYLIIVSKTTENLDLLSKPTISNNFISNNCIKAHKEFRSSIEAHNVAPNQSQK